MSLLLLLVLLAALVVAGVPIWVSLVAATSALLLLDPVSPLVVVPLRMFHGGNSFALVAVPLFIFAGLLMNRAGISARLIDFASSLVGSVRGGLAMTTTLTSMFFSEVSGSAVADAAALGSVLIPGMTSKGYPPAFAAAVLSSSATIAIIIPPSIPMILYGSITGTSIARLFLAGFVPGILTGAAIMATSAVLARFHGFAAGEPFRPARVGRTFARAFWGLSLPVIILGGIFTGFFTATEAAAVAVVAALLIGLSSRELTPAALGPVCAQAAHQTGVVMMLVAASAVLGWYLTIQQVPEMLASFVLDHVDGRVGVLLVLNLALLVAGMFLHSTAAIVLLVPIFMPLAQQIGLDPVHFGLIVTINLAIGQQTPPVASVLIVACSIARQPMGEVMKVNAWFILAMLAVLLLVTFIPAVTLWLPSLLAGS